MKKYNKYFKNYKKDMFVFFLLNILIWIISLISPMISSAFIDSLIKEKEYKDIITIVYIMLIISVVTIIISYFNNILKTKLMNEISFDCISDTIGSYHHILLSKVNKQDPLFVVQRINKDIAQIINFILASIIDVILNILCMICIFIYLINISKKLVILILAFIPIYYLIYKVIQKPLYDRGYKAQNDTDQFFKNSTHQLSMTRLIKIKSIFYETTIERKEYFKNMYDSVIKHKKLSCIYSSLDSIVSIFFQIIFFLLFVKKVYEKEISVGTFIIINTYFNMILNCIKYFMSFSEEYQNIKASKNRVAEIDILPKDKNGLEKINKINDIVVNNLTFSYEPENYPNKFVLNNLNLKFEKNNVYIVKGKNGCGKSTLFDVILGLYTEDLDKGEILINGINIKEMDMYDFRKRCLGFVGQKNYLGRKTVKEYLNINDIVTIINELEIKEFFINNHFNINYLLEKKMCDLSGGQQKKIIILKEIIKSPEIIIFDEPVSSLDYESKIEFNNIIQNIKKEKIIIMSTHDYTIDCEAYKEILL